MLTILSCTIQSMMRLRLASTMVVFIIRKKKYQERVERGY